MTRTPDEELADVLRQAEPSRLDDVTRARVGAGIDDALDQAAATPGGGRSRWVAVAAVTAVAAAVVTGWWVVPTRPPGPTAALLRPYVVAGASWTLDGHDVDRLEVPAGATVRAELGDRARITLVGPAELESRPGLLMLSRGTLLVDYDHAATGGLLVESPGTSTRVTGTLFSVEVDGDGQASQVAVARGEVKVEQEGRQVVVARAQSLARGKLGPIPAATAALLAEHDASVLPPRGDWGVVHVESPVGEEVWIGDRPVGRAPLAAMVPAGVVSVRAADGGSQAAPSSPTARPVSRGLCVRVR